MEYIYIIYIQIRGHPRGHTQITDSGLSSPPPSDQVLAAARARGSGGPRADSGAGDVRQGDGTPAQHPIQHRRPGVQQRRHWAAVTSHHRHHQEAA